MAAIRPVCVCVGEGDPSLLRRQLLGVGPGGLGILGIPILTMAVVGLALTFTDLGTWDSQGELWEPGLRLARGEALFFPLAGKLPPAG